MKKEPVFFKKTGSWWFYQEGIVYKRFVKTTRSSPGE